MCNTYTPDSLALMPKIPGVTSLYGDAESGLDLEGLDTHPFLLGGGRRGGIFTEAYRITKPEKPQQNVSPYPMRLDFQFLMVNLCSLTFCAYSVSQIPYVALMTRSKKP